ncbi:flagellar hook capping protein [Aquabacterium sp. A7-Y]|uniref:flagellar hook assembly protein FlgD n=1 Tax=Aquabacterium sp. A7-Y TaxID=1349605 RepID=UPI00223DB189|nr:flagellar hook capping FlgD N-terminal domain-containing protein [Aquabacterium sp. A7-Y]MCW7540869.1 flagellar hook capping protein [Aquabacterium sp. A7-Y]
MATSPLGGVSNINPASASLSMEDLLRVMLTELTYQDPLKPVENKDFMAQIAQFSSLDASRQLNEGLEQLLGLQSLNQSVGLLGKTIDARTANGAVTGQVKSLSLATGVPQLTIQTTTGETIAGISIGQVESIR